MRDEVAAGLRLGERGADLDGHCTRIWGWMAAGAIGRNAGSKLRVGANRVVINFINFVTFAEGRSATFTSAGRAA
jgi:hypothetical protein